MLYATYISCTVFTDLKIAQCSTDIKEAKTKLEEAKIIRLNRKGRSFVTIYNFEE